MEIATLGLVGTLLLTMLYLAHRIDRVKSAVKNIEKRLNEFEHQLRQLVKGIRG